MRCERCQGEGWLAFLGRVEPFRMNTVCTCPDCEGSGIAYCCDDAGVNPPNTWSPLEEAVFGAP